MGSLNVHAISYKDGWRESIFDSCLVEFELFYDVNLLISLFCLMSMWEAMHTLIKLHIKKMFLFVIMLQQSRFAKDSCIFIFKSYHEVTYDVFKDFHDLIDYIHNIVHLKLKASSLAFNTSGVEYLWFDFVGFTLWATSLNAHWQKMQVS
jgi:hypothetical protein